MEYFIGFIISYYLLVEVVSPWAISKLWELKIEAELSKEPVKKARIRFRKGRVLTFTRPIDAGSDINIIINDFLYANRGKEEEARHRDYLMGMAQDRNRAMNACCQGGGNGLTGQLGASQQGNYLGF